MHIHILAIAGTMTAPLAVQLKNQGHSVTGSDQQKIYPPLSDIFSKNHLDLPNTFKIDKSIDLVIVGSGFKAFSQTQNEFELIKKLKIPYISATDYIAQNLAKKKSILVAGSYGKTTITSLLVWTFLKAGIDPSYMFGGEIINNITPLHFGNSDFSIIEADESINGLDTQAKFLSYPVKYLVLTGANWEHKDSYKTELDNLDAFKKLVAKIPKDGLLIYNPKGPNIDKLLPFCQSKIIPYDFGFNFSTNLIGKHNHENIVAAYTLCRSLGISDIIIQQAIKNYLGVKRRLELVSKINNTYFFDDFAQSPSRIISAIQAIKDYFPNHKIKVYFEPHASFLQHKSGIIGFKEAFNQASEVIIGKINFNHNTNKLTRTTARDFINEIGNTCHYVPLDKDIVKHFSQSLKSGDVLIHFSSGGLDGLKNFTKIIKNYSFKIKN